MTTSRYQHIAHMKALAQLDPKVLTAKRNQLREEAQSAREKADAYALRLETHTTSDELITLYKDAINLSRQPLNLYPEDQDYRMTAELCCLLLLNLGYKDTNNHYLELGIYSYEKIRKSKQTDINNLSRLFNYQYQHSITDDEKLSSLSSMIQFHEHFFPQSNELKLDIAYLYLQKAYLLGEKMGHQSEAYMVLCTALNIYKWMNPAPVDGDTVQYFNEANNFRVRLGENLKQRIYAINAKMSSSAEYLNYSILFQEGLKILSAINSTGLIIDNIRSYAKFFTLNWRMDASYNEKECIHHINSILQLFASVKNDLSELTDEDNQFNEFLYNQLDVFEKENKHLLDIYNQLLRPKTFSSGSEQKTSVATSETSLFAKPANTRKRKREEYQHKAAGKEKIKKLKK